MKIALAAHLTCAAVRLGLLFADQGRLASVCTSCTWGSRFYLRSHGKAAQRWRAVKASAWWTSARLPFRTMLTA